MNPMQSPNTGVGGSAHRNRENENKPWEYDFKKNPPPEGAEVELLCDWYGGEFVMRGTRVNYKPGSKKQIKQGDLWRMASALARPH